MTTIAGFCPECGATESEMPSGLIDVTEVQDAERRLMCSRCLHVEPERFWRPLSSAPTDGQP